MRGELARIELAKTVPGKPRGIVDQQAHTGQPVRSREDALGAIRLREVGDDLRGALRDRILFMVALDQGEDAST